MERIEGESLGHLTAHVIFLDVAGTPEKDSATIALARSIQGVHVHTGAAPSVARIWGASTSGQVFLYDPLGQLRFSGGITAGRGHEGLNAGHSAIVSFLRTGRLATNQAPVFGCSLLGSL
ncbi:hypothetical protein [uncultured Paludibaculum sp.]|uniref:hypothetical protein n=1 Tax=uncultured Paludibaculum sp. TaxID=1765020 RepID=UPI002AABF09D|nr:hypothetical protein [uncultured Paludibaculum sp.]